MVGKSVLSRTWAKARKRPSGGARARVPGAQQGGLRACRGRGREQGQTRGEAQIVPKSAGCEWDESNVHALLGPLPERVEGPAVGQGLFLHLALDSAGWEVMGDLLSAPHCRHWPSAQPLGWPLLSAAGPSWRRRWPCLASMAHVGSCSPGWPNRRRCCKRCSPRPTTWKSRSSSMRYLATEGVLPAWPCCLG